MILEDKWLALAAGTAISLVSAWYSIVGLTAIFAGAFVSIIIMGSVLEFGKIITASYLYRNWKQMPIVMKSYFSIAVVVLMLITSMGTFGYLSKAHIEQTASTGDTQAKIERIDQNITREKERISRADKASKQLDEAINTMISNDKVSKGLEFRRKQEAERKELTNEIKAAQTNIDKLLDERLPLSQEVRTMQREVGPVRYVAELVYGQSDPTILEKTIRWIIILLVLVMDPLAVLLIMTTTKKKDPKAVRADKYINDEKEWLAENSNAVATDGVDWNNMDIVVKKK